MFKARGLGGMLGSVGDFYGSDPAASYMGGNIEDFAAQAQQMPQAAALPSFRAGLAQTELGSIPLAGGNTPTSYGNPFGAEIGMPQSTGASYSAGYGDSGFNPFGRLSFRGMDWGGGGPLTHEEAANWDTGVSAEGMNSLGGDWAKVDQWNSSIQKAQQQVYQKTGVMVPGNVIKSIMKIESGGEHLSANYAGYVGLMQVGPGSWGVGSDWDLGQATSNPDYNIFAGTMELARRYQDAKSQNPSYTWSNVAVGYFSGHYVPNGSSDAWNSDFAYQKMFDQNLAALGGVGGSGGYSMPGSSLPGGYGGGGTASGDVFSLIQGASFSSWGEFDAPSDNGYYTYGTQYGLNGTNHTGLDIAGPVGGAQYAPMGGTVVCASTGNGPGADGSGCGAFNYVPNFSGAPQRQGAGRIEILLDNGVSLIYGHSLDTYVQPGQRVTAGQVIGTLGGMNSAHVHLEARIRNPNMPSGWQIVDPRQVIGGSGFTPGAAPGQSPQQPKSAGFAGYLGRVTTHAPAMGQSFGYNSPYSQSLGRVRW